MPPVEIDTSIAKHRVRGERNGGRCCDGLGRSPLGLVLN